jgi:hypothetical protein
MLLDDILPEYQINAVYSIEIQAPREEVYKTILHLPFMDSLIFKVLMRLRELPSKLFGKGVGFFPKEIGRLDDVAEKSKFALLGKKENEELVFGLIGRFWDVINTDPRDISGLAEFNAFNKPEYGKVVMNFYLEPLEDRTKLYTETRVYFSDDKYLNRFKIYWFFISFFSGLIRRTFLRRIKANAEKSKVNKT